MGTSIFASDSPTELFPLGLRRYDYNFCVHFLFLLTHVTCPAHLILCDAITLTTFRDDNKL